MNQAKSSSRINSIIRAAVAAAVLPILFLYVMISKPDYKIMNALSYVVLPVAQVIGDIVTWPIRAIGGAIENVTEISKLRTENEELRIRLDQALINKNNCEIAINENKKLKQELSIKNMQPYDTLIADVIHDNSAIGHNTFIINRGIKDGVKQGMAVASTDMNLVGVVIDSANDFSRVRALTDVNASIAVRIVGSDVYGFVTGNGAKRPKIGFFSDPEFQLSDDIKLVTSNISGMLPAGILVGKIVDGDNVEITPVSKVSRVMVLKFDAEQNEYK